MSARYTLLALVLIATPAFAQSGSRSSGGSSLSPFLASAVSGSSAGAFEASTALAGELQGLAALEDARGRAALNRAKAAVVLQQARAAALENRYEQVRLSYHIQDTREERRQASLKTKAARLAKRRVNRVIAAAPSSLAQSSLAELSPETSLVAWPAAVQASHYAKLRAEVEGLIELRSKLGEENAATSAALKKALGRVVAQATFDVANRRIASHEYEATKEFVRNLSRRYINPDLVHDSHRKTMLAMSEL